MMVEIIGGILANSLAIITDAAHLFSDISGFLISIFAICIGKKQSNKVFTFGYHRAEVIGALLSVISIWILTALLIKESIDRLTNPSPIDSKIMLFTAIFGLICNLFMMNILHSDGLEGHSHHHNCNHSHGNGHGDSHSHSPSNQDHIHTHDKGQCKDNMENVVQEKEKLKNEQPSQLNNNNNITINQSQNKELEENVNIRAAIIHIIGDILQSVGVVIAAIVIYLKPEYVIADPLCTLLFSVIVFITTLNITISCVNILMETCPENYKIETIELKIKEKFKDIISIHNFHIWTLSAGKNAACLHIVSFNKGILNDVNETLRNKFNIQYSTIQIESPEENELLFKCIYSNSKK